jgi:hypothetical protein
MSDIQDKPTVVEQTTQPSMAAPETRKFETGQGQAPIINPDLQKTAVQIFEDIKNKMIELSSEIQKDLPPQDEMVHMVKETIGNVEIALGRMMKNLEQHGTKMVEEAKTERAKGNGTEEKP